MKAVVKICGMRDADNIRAVEELAKPDLMGFICWERSPRNVAQVPAYLPRCPRVGVFVNASLYFILKQTEAFQFSYIQLHGSESPQFCKEIREQSGCKVIKAVSISSAEDLASASRYEGFADLLLFDTKCTTVGGSGRKFSWDILDSYRSGLPFLLSGGIGPEDAGLLRQFRHPLCIGFDINSCFEVAPGIKDTDKTSTFINTIRGHEPN